MTKRTLMFALVLILLAGAALAETAPEASPLDETVYALLTPDGAVRDVLVVSHIDTPVAGEYAGFSDYYIAFESLSAMVLDVEPRTEGESVVWTLPADDAGFFTSGRPKHYALPFHFSVEYALDGEPIAPDALAGQAGHVQITLRAETNPQAEEAFRTRFMAQIQAPISLADCNHIEAPGATAALVGQTLTLAYTVLPGQDAAFTIDFDTPAFSMEQITVSCTTVDIGEMLGVDLSGMMGQTTELTDGASALADGAEQLASGAAALPGGVEQLQNGLSQLATIIGALPGRAEAFAETNGALKEQISEYVNAVNALVDLLPEESRADILERGAALAATLAEDDGFSQLSTAIRFVSARIGALPEQIGTMAEGATELVDALGQIAEGQRQLSDGLSEAVSLLTGIAPAQESGALPSFASPAHEARSVQIVYLIDAIPAPAPEFEEPEPAPTKTLWQRVLDLF